MPDDVAAVLGVNRAFYEAFEAGDLDAMSDVWSHADHVVCTHPGWPTLRGWAAVGSSWAALFQGPERLQFIVTEGHAVVRGEVAWVTCTENILGVEASAAVAALNLFERDGDGAWRVTGHHGSPVHAPLPG